MTIRICSFNLHNAGQNAKEEKLKKIAEVIEKENFDIVAFQEVFCPKTGIVGRQNFAPPLSSILLNLGFNWNGYFDAPRQARDAKEGYAFLWNTKTVDLARTKLQNGIERIFYPRIFNQYQLKKENQQITLIRNPLFGRFFPKDGQFVELRLLNTHIRFSKQAGIDSDNTDMVSLSDICMRKNEFDVLTRTIYPKLADKIYGRDECGDSRPSYTIMLGDYNLNLNRNWTKSPYIPEEIFEISDNGLKSSTKVIQTFQEGLTTLKMIQKGHEEEYKKMQKYANNFDHVTYDTRRFSGIGIKIRKIDAVRQYNNSDFVHYRNNISDHIPIYVEIASKDNLE